MNTSSRMMSFGEEQKIHVSKTTGDLLPKDFKVTERGQIEVKGKGAMTTCWVEDRVGRASPIKDEVSAEVSSIGAFWTIFPFIPSQVMAKYKAKVEGTDKKEEESKEE